MFSLSRQRKFGKITHLHMRESDRARYLGDAVYAAMDGIVTTFAIVVGATGASLASSVILILGTVNLLANGLSMAGGNFLGTRSEKEYLDKERKGELWEIENLSDEEREEVRTILLKRGIAQNLVDPLTKLITSDERLWIDFMMAEELGTPPTITISPWKTAASTLLAFIGAGLAPLLFYVVSLVFVENSRYVSFAATAASLFVVGVLRARVNKLSSIRSGIEVLLIGGAAAAVAYAIGYFLRIAIP